jgi:hypothetical protein
MEEQMSKAAVIRYRTKPDAADENQRLIEKVFAELATKAPTDLTYTSVRLADGVSFVHIVTGENDGVAQLAAFQEFQRNLGDRLEAAPERQDGTPIGSYGG